MVRKQGQSSVHCPPQIQVLDAISGKWTVAIVYILSKGTKRHSELFRLIPGISQKMLTQKLRELERDGFVARKVYPVVPPQVDYSLTPFGNSLITLLSQIYQWGEAHYHEVEKARSHYDKST